MARAHRVFLSGHIWHVTHRCHEVPDTNNPGALLPIGEQMGEGWSDLHALILTAQATDTGNTPRGVGAYISFQDGQVSSSKVTVAIDVKNKK